MPSVRTQNVVIGAVAAIAAASIAYPASATAAATTVAVSSQGQGIEDFYAARRGQPVWFEGSRLTDAGRKALQLIDRADADGLDPARYRTRELDALLAKAERGNKGARRKADAMLSGAFAAYASDLRRARSPEMKFVDPLLKPGTAAPRAILERAASAPSLLAFVSNMAWMHPNYARLRRALLADDGTDNRRRDLLKINLERVRALPAALPRYIVVNAAEQRLYMYEGDKVADTMKVVVGQQRDERKTPMMAGLLHQASLNPYWNVPPDLVGDNVAVHVLKHGINWMKVRGYEVLSDWTEDAMPIDPASVDWQAVMDGTVEVRVRQNPGPRNGLGKVKYSFTNPFGVYLHDTSAKELLNEETRLYSGGCIRLEDAARLGEWLFGRPLRAPSADPEINVALDAPVPVYVTYLTAVPSGSEITYLDDVYGWDAERLAQGSAPLGTVAAR